MTLVLDASAKVPNIVRANLPSVAIRIPNHPVALALLNAFGGGIVAPSANLSGRPSPTMAQHVLNDLDGRIDLILDAGQTTIGVESTVIDVTNQPPIILRQGGLTREEIEKLIGNVDSPRDAESLKRSPGTRYRHYAPNAKVVLIQRGNVEQLRLEINRLKRNESYAAIYSSPEIGTLTGRAEFVLHVREPEALARDLFKIFRTIDERGIPFVFVEEFDEQGIGAAIMERLRKASATE
jgi:L-threonylcarbamoyladenylate synthase